jgi:hypothetical protein
LSLTSHGPALLRVALAAAVLSIQASAGLAVSLAAPPAKELPELCRNAARVAAARHGLPAEMMQAISLVETRHNVDGVSGPWPWTLNVEGRGYWYDTRAKALAHAAREIASGRISVDLGCFQLNYRWHGENFEALGEMLDPELAADYAARFLGGLFAETGDWMRAAGHYHSRTPVHARRYRDMISLAMARPRGANDIATIAASSRSGPAAAPRPGPRPASPSGIKDGQIEPLYAIVRVAARLAGRPAGSAAPGAVVLRMFARPSRPLLAAPGINP